MFRVKSLIKGENLIGSHLDQFLDLLALALQVAHCLVFLCGYFDCFNQFGSGLCHNLTIEIDGSSFVLQQQSLCCLGKQANACSSFLDFLLLPGV